MKRSEMIDILCSDINVDNVTVRLWPSEADAILTTLEQAGMSPPGYEGRIANGKKCVPEMGPVDVTWFKTWEPEDD